jgi:hypothetical protein
LLFDRDFDLRNELARFPPAGGPWMSKETGLPQSPWAIGYSLLAMPFLGAGTVLDALAGNPADGYSRYAVLGYSLANTVLTGLGLMALFYFLNEAGKLWGVSRPVDALFVTLAVFFGTTVGYYAFSNMSHASTVLGSSLFLACWWRVREDNQNIRGWALLGLFGGILSIIRWQEICYVAAPFLFDIADKAFFSRFRPWLRSRIAYLAVVSLCWVPQLVEWKYIYGRFFLIPYSVMDSCGEKVACSSFIHLPPRYIPQLLFSTENGWFLWTPLCFIGVCGLLYGLVRFGRVFFPWLVVFALEVALIGSSDTWHGGESFSSRYLTSSSALVGLGLVTILYSAGRRMRWAVVGAASILCVFTCAFALQFRLNLIPGQERLTASEMFTDKLLLLQASRRKQAVQRAATLLQNGEAQSAIQVLEEADARYVESRYVISGLREAYRAHGQQAKAEDQEHRLENLMQSRLW